MYIDRTLPHQNGVAVPVYAPRSAYDCRWDVWKLNEN